VVKMDAIMVNVRHRIVVNEKKDCFLRSRVFGEMPFLGESGGNLAAAQKKKKKKKIKDRHATCIKSQWLFFFHTVSL